MDHRDLVVATLADAERYLAATCAGLLEALHAAVDQLRKRETKIRKLQAENDARRDELRRYTARGHADP